MTTGLIAALIVSGLGTIIYAIGMILAFKDLKDAEHRFVNAEAGRLDAIRDLGTAQSEIAECRKEIERKDRALLFAAKKFDEVSRNAVVGMPAGALLDLVRGVHQDENGDGAVPAEPAPELPTAPARPAAKGAVPRPGMGLIEDLT